VRNVALSACFLIVATTLAVSGCSGSSGGSSASATADSGGSAVYKVGFTDGLTGPTAAETQPELADVRAVFNAVNAAGGINGHKIDLIALDQGAPGSGEATANVLKLSSDGVSAILGLVISNDCTSVASTAAQVKVPVLCVNDAPSDQVPVQPYLYVTTGLEDQEVPAMVKFGGTLLKGNDKVDILTNDNIGAVSWAAAMKKQATATGMTVGGVYTMPEDATTIAPYLSKIVADKPAALFIEIFPNFEPALVQGLKSAGLDIPIIGSIGDMDYASQKADPDFYGVHIVDPLEPGTPGLTTNQQQLLAAYAKLGVTTAVAINASEGPDYLLGPYAVVAGLRACGYPCSGAQMAAALDKQSSTAVNGIIPAGAFGFSPTNHTGAKNYSFWRFDTSAGVLKPVGSSYPAAGPTS
jgi:branched-chain amino acid transport system substrate-binding protein